MFHQLLQLCVLCVLSAVGSAHPTAATSSVEADTAFDFIQWFDAAGGVRHGLSLRPITAPGDGPAFRRFFTETSESHNEHDTLLLVPLDIVMSVSTHSHFVL